MHSKVPDFMKMRLKIIADGAKNMYNLCLGFTKPWKKKKFSC